MSKEYISEKAKLKLSLLKKGKKRPEMTGSGNGRWRGGLPKCIDCKKQLKYYKVKRCSVCHRLSMIGKKRSLETRIKLAIWQKGSLSHRWKGGITKENALIRESLQFDLWREAVFKRDNWTCQSCSVRGGKLQAHHIKSFAKYKELRFAIDNGVTLCVDCHKLTDNYAGRTK